MRIMYEIVYVCIYVCLYLCMYVCMYVCIILCHCVFIIIYTLILAADWSISLLYTAKNYRYQTVDKYLTSNCCPFAVRLLSDVSDDKCSCALFVHWIICAQIVNRTFVHKRLTNIFDVS